jgi:electron transport complex protein RnfD
MEFHTPSSPHLVTGQGVAEMMRLVIYALLPGLVVSIWILGWGVLFNVLLASLSAVTAEALMLRLRGRPVADTLQDTTALVTGILLALALPPLAPWWIPVIGSLFAIVVAKQLYGGLGYNPFNPAMAGYVVLLISFPKEMTLWGPPAGLEAPRLGPVEAVALMFGGQLPAGQSLDGLTMATPLDTVKTQLGLDLTLTEILEDPRFGAYGGKGWEWINLLYLLGGIALWRLRVIQWQIPAGVLGGLFLASFLFYIGDPDNYSSPLFHLFSGATMLGAFFIATDPVSASTTPRGRLYYGLGIGLLIYVIRTWGGYPDGVAFAVLLMNMAAPTIDHYTQPRTFGHDR